MAGGWDPLVRITHWGIAAAVVANGLLTEPGKDIHVWTGVAAGGLLALRLAWGLVGPGPARFASFPPSPVAAVRHVGDIIAGRHVHHRSHNPLGALMVYAIWATLGIVVATGAVMTWGTPGPALARAADPVPRLRLAEMEGRSPAGEERDDEGHERGHEGKDGEEALEEVHEASANLLFLLAGLHVAGVIFETARSGRGVIRRMTTGRGG